MAFFLNPVLIMIWSPNDIFMIEISPSGNSHHYCDFLSGATLAPRCRVACSAGEGLRNYRREPSLSLKATYLKVL